MMAVAEDCQKNQLSLFAGNDHDGAGSSLQAPNRTLIPIKMAKTILMIDSDSETELLPKAVDMQMSLVVDLTDIHNYCSTPQYEINRAGTN